MTDERKSRRWKKLRVSVAATLPQLCARCGLPVLPTDDWDLGHVVAQTLGGSSASGVRPEHRSCNRDAGRKLIGWRKRPGFFSPLTSRAGCAGGSLSPLGQFDAPPGRMPSRRW